MGITDSPESLENYFRAVEQEYGDRAGTVHRRIRITPDIDSFVEVRFPEREWGLVVSAGHHQHDRHLVLTGGLTCQIRGGDIRVIGAPQTDRGLFCALLVDLIAQLVSRAGETETILVSRINAWRRMLGRGFDNGLSPEARMGLHGELLVLRDLLLPVLGSRSVAAWTGPSGGTKDFTHRGTAIEVKSVSVREPHQCRVNNEYQLDSAGLDQVLLVHQVIGDSSDGESLNDVVDALRSNPRLLPVLAELDDRLLETGWLDSQRQQYAEDRRALIRRRCYHVGEGFPRMVPDDLAPGVSGVSYVVDLAACRSHLIKEGLLRSAVSGSPLPPKEQ
ncbi:PD-(D/E)XK motif protein [Nocardiopsis deserti]|uniref:PD-(D/E)XK motif protein n=1 Tax=Nocardiopsis deserti TaxID=2605988 RepID=UPI0016800C1B|nr:PD-(D/E)XK motif protein [Nocardiopsis deserti]